MRRVLNSRLRNLNWREGKWVLGKNQINQMKQRRNHYEEEHDQ
jgi:hypothetical protein